MPLPTHRFCTTFLRTGYLCPYRCAQRNIDCPTLPNAVYAPALIPPTPPEVSSSQLTLQLRLAAGGEDGNGGTIVGWPEDLLNTAADVIDRLTRELIDLSSRTPRPVIINPSDLSPC